MSCNLIWVGLQQCRTVLWEKSSLVTEWISLQTRMCRQYVTTHWLPSIHEFFRLFQRKSADEGSSTLGGLNANITLPATGEEAMHRLLACKGRDPYSILGNSIWTFIFRHFILIDFISQVFERIAPTKRFDVTISDKLF